jgi:hypothetical protein
VQSARGVALAVRVESNRARPGGGSVGFLEKTFRFGATAITICATLDKELNLQLKLAPMLPTDHEAPSPTLSPDSDELEQIGRSYLGHRVSAYWGGDRCWYSGTIIGEAGDVLNVRYDDQEEGEVHIGTDIFVAHCRNATAVCLTFYELVVVILKGGSLLRHRELLAGCNDYEDQFQMRAGHTARDLFFFVL